MRMSTKSRFAVTAMIDVALREDRGPVSLAAISERHQISLSYLEQLFSKLRQAGLVESTRGPGGGYSLGRSAESISMADILSAVDAPSADEAADEQSSWMNSDLWSSLNHQMLTHLQSINLRQLVAEQRAKGVAIEPPPAKVASVKRGVFARKPEPLKITAPNSVFALAGNLMPSRS